MKKFLKLLFMFNLFLGLAYAQQDPQEAEDQFEDGERYNSRLLKQILQYEFKNEEEGSGLIFMLTARTKYRLGIGANYYRYDTFESSGNTDGFYSEMTRYYQFQTHTYFASWFSLMTDGAWNNFELKRYTGKAFTTTEFRSRKLSLGVNFDIHNFFIYYMYAFNKIPYLYKDENYDVNTLTLKTGSHIGGLGYRFPLFSIMVIDVFFQFEQFNRVNLDENGEFSGYGQKFGLKVYSHTKHSFGVEVLESIDQYTSGDDTTRIKQFRIMPYYRF